MLTLTKGETKYWYLTLTEKTTIANPYYLFSLKHRQTNKEYNFLLTDVSNYKNRYNKFSINEDTYDFYEGEYYYCVYAQISSSNLNPSLANEIVEIGMAKILLPVEEEVFYNPN